MSKLKEHDHIGEHLYIKHQCPHFDKKFTLLSLNAHYRKMLCPGKIHNESKKFYNENKIIDTSKTFHP